MSFKETKVQVGIFVIILLAYSCANSETRQNNTGAQSTGSVAENSQSFSTDSVEYYENLLIKDSLNIDVRFKLAAIYYSNANTGKAIDQFLIINYLDEKNLAALFNLGNLYYDIQNNQEAIKYYEKFLKMDNSNLNVRCDLATCYLNIDDPATAIRLLRQNIKINASHPQSHHNLSVVLNKTGKAEEAEEEMRIYNSLVSKKP